MLMQKADLGNLERIRRGFPEAVAVWEAWRRAPTQEEFFMDHMSKPSVSVK
jgi:hypothetical protein